MAPFSMKTAVPIILLSLASSVLSQDDGYIGYTLETRGDPASTTYETDDTNTYPGVYLPQEPDVLLNATVHVGQLDLEVNNLTAKINLDAKVLNLLNFNAGVAVSVDAVKLNIDNVRAKVLLEVRLENVVAMIDDVLNGIDNNPALATLGSTASNAVANTTTAANSPNTTVTKRSAYYNILHNILYSINDYSGKKHTNVILGQDGVIYKQFLDNNGYETGRQDFGYYSRDMNFTGHDKTVSIGGQALHQLGYTYMPFPGLDVYCYVYTNAAGVFKTQVISEAEGGGTSTISDDSKA